MTEECRHRIWLVTGNVQNTKDAYLDLSLTQCLQRKQNTNRLTLNMINQNFTLSDMNSLSKGSNHISHKPSEYTQYTRAKNKQEPVVIHKHQT